MVFNVQSNLTIEEWWVVIHICDLHSEGADPLQTGLPGVDSLHSDGDRLSVLALSVEHLVGEHLAGLLVHRELGPLLVGLLDDGVLHLPVDPLVLVHGVHLDDGAAVRSSLLNLGRVGGAVGEDWLVVVDVCDEDHHHRRGGVDGVGLGWSPGLRAALPVVHGRHVQLILVPVQVDGPVDEPDDPGVWFYPEQPRGCGSANKSESNSITVLE